MKYLIGLDIDGTLLTDDGVIRPETISYIKKLQEDGHIISLLTGRPYRTTKPIYDELGLTSPIANYSGSYIHHPLDDAFENHSYKMPSSYIKEIMERFSEEIINGFCEAEDHVYLYEHDVDLENWLSSNDGELTVGPFDFEDDISGAVLFAHFSLKNQLDDALSKYQHLGYRYWSSLKVDDLVVVELYTTLSSKANAMEIIRNFYGIDHTNTIAIGDGTNDIEMLQYAHHSAAIAKAPDKVKQSAKDITGSNNEFGVIDYIKKVLDK